MNEIINKGTGAGGARTNHNGLAFENKTNFEKILLEQKWEKKFLDKTHYYLELVKNNEYLYWMCKYSFQVFVLKHFGLKKTDIFRQPDEVFIKINEKNINVYVIEKKNQNGEGSVEEKLRTGSFIRKEYVKMLSSIKDSNISVEYGYCVSKFLYDKYLSKKPKYNIMREILEEEKIPIFYGEDENYFSIVTKWIS
jgi:hypothetical protein